MVRDFIINGAKAPDAMHKAKVAMVTGMGVVKEDSVTDKFANITDTETAADIFIVDKERVPSGLNCAKDDMSDYDDDFVKIKANEMVTMDKYHAGEKFGTDQYDSTITSDLAIDTRVAWKAGLVTKATIASPYKFKGFHNDNGHMLAQIEVSDIAAANV